MSAETHSAPETASRPVAEVVAVPSAGLSTDASAEELASRELNGHGRDKGVPLYVQRMFRVKAFALLSIQLLCVFIVTVLVHVFVRPSLEASGFGRAVFILVGLFTIGLILFLNAVKNKFPANYMLIAIITVAVGFFWGLAPILLCSCNYMHFQVLGILTFTAMGSTALVYILTRESLSPRTTLTVAVFYSWIVACCVDLWILDQWGVSAPEMAGLAMLIALLLLLLLVLVHDSSHLLVKCNADNFALVIVRMDSALLVVSLPIFLMSFCCLPPARVPADAGDEDDLAAEP